MTAIARTVPQRTGPHRDGYGRRSLTRVIVVTAMIVTALSATSTGTATAATSGTVRDGLSRPVYSYAGAIRESVWVDAGFDGDGDGRSDRVAADIVRPREAAEQGRRVPVIMDASPYYSCCGRGNEGQLKTYDADGHLVQAPLFYDNYFVPRGYAVVLVDLAGTNRSDGCVDIGGRYDIGSAKAVVDWLNGRAWAYSSRTGGTRVTANWTTGATGMIGKSWDATIANGVAATGVRGLKTIVSIAGISSWYDYYFHQAVALQDGPAWLSDDVESPQARARCAAVQAKIVEGSPPDGSWTPFWSERNYVKDADQVRASVFAVAGMQDLNVRGKHFGQWWDALRANGVERKVWLSQTGHVDPFDFRREVWVDTVHRWFDHYLLEVDNGIEREPMADVERTPERWSTDRTWPAPGTVTARLGLNAGAQDGVGSLTTTPARPGSSASFTDDPNLWEEDWAAAVDTSTPAKTSFTTGVLRKPLRLSGGGRITLTASSSTTSAYLSAVLVDLGPQTIRDYLGPGSGISTGQTRACVGEGTEGDTGCFLTTSAQTVMVERQVFSRGWAALGGTRPLIPGRRYSVTIALAATDHVIPAGHRLALIVAGSDSGLIESPDTTPTVTLDLARSVARLPLVGGAPALIAAPMTAPPTATKRTTPPGRTAPGHSPGPLMSPPGPRRPDPVRASRKPRPVPGDGRDRPRANRYRGSRPGPAGPG